jgi:L-alanine-DL-glutamate epimerase-like enolase superfamily enzyme
LPSLQFSITFLGAAILAHQRGTSLFELFGRSVKPKVHVNAVAGTLPEEELTRQILLSVEQGFHVIKLKATKKVDKLIPTLEAVSNQRPGIQFRLDANRSWPIDEIRERTSAFSHLPIEYVEEPSTFRGNEELEQMIRESRLPIALDESVQTTEHLYQMMSRHPDLTFIIKPMLFGNLIRLFETIQSNRSSFRQIIVTTTLESAVGRSMIAVCSALFGDPNRGHGLRTGTIFERDILPDPTDEPVLEPEFFSKPAFHRFSSTDRSQLEPL